MTDREAAALVTFVKDHDTRFEATAVKAQAQSFVQLTRPEDGSRLDPVYSIDEYDDRYICGEHATPTVRSKWDAWKRDQAGMT